MKHTAIRAEAGKIRRFASIGLIATILHFFTSLSLANLFSLGLQFSNTIAFCIAFFLSFLGHHHFTFRSQQKRTRTMLRFIIISSLGFLASAFILKIFAATEVNANLQLLLAASTIPALTYPASRFWVF